MSLRDWFKKPSKKTLDDLIRGDEVVTMSDVLALDEITCRPEIVAAGFRLLTSEKHAHDGYNILGPIAAEGDAEAQFIMGNFCEAALGRPEQAAIWFQRAADQGHSQAQRNYADMLMAGQGIQANPQKAFTYYEKAAKGGVPEAQFVLGEFFRSGMHVPKDLEKAKAWYEQAKKNGFAHAETRLQQMAAQTPGESGR